MNSNPMRAGIAKAGQLTVYGLFASQASRDPNMIALASGSLRRTYGELNERVLRLASALRDRGVVAGDRIALLSENRPEYVEIELAAACLGAIVACQNWRLAPAEVQHCVDLVSPVLIIASERHAGLASGLDLRGTPLLVIDRDHEALLASATPLAPVPDVDPEDGLVILYTSGTTGLPKGALISHRAEIARMTALRLDMRVTEQDGFVAWAPMFHMGSTDQLLGALMSGATVHVVDGFHAETIVDIMEHNLIGWMLLMPGSIEPVVDILKSSNRRPKGIRAVGAMADLLPKSLIAELSGLTGAPFLNSFGSTETGLPPTSSALISPGTIPESLSKRKSSMCDPTVFSGYWGADATNARDFKDGWFRMGDLFRRNADGSYDFVDRAKYLIKSGGENIYPAEIERVLLADPRVSDAAVVRTKDDKWGEVPVAFISRKDEALCRTALAGYKRPKQVHFIPFEEFPRSTTGKSQRHELEARLKAKGEAWWRGPLQ